MDVLADLPVFFADFAVPATLGGAPLRGLLDESPGLALGVVGGTQRSFQLPEVELAGDPRGETLTVGAAAYTVADWTVADGIATLALESA